MGLGREVKLRHEQTNKGTLSRNLQASFRRYFWATLWRNNTGY